MRRLMLVAVAVLLVAGCGGGSGSDKSTASARTASTPHQSGDAEEEEGGKGLSELPASDRHAYLQIASVTGVLNKDASLLAVSRIMHPEDTAALPALHRRIDALRPRDRLLRRLRGRALAAITLSTRSRQQLQNAVRAAPALLRAIRKITLGLTRYADTHPAVGGFVPD